MGSFLDEGTDGLYCKGEAFVEDWRLKVASLSNGCCPKIIVAVADRSGGD